MFFLISGLFNGGIEMTKTLHINKRSRKNNRSLRKQLIICMTSIIIIVLGCGFFGNIRSSAHDSISDDTYYTSITIERGDTLWSIAEEYITDDFDSIPEYIQALKNMNGLEDDCIRSGMSLTVSYKK